MFKKSLFFIFLTLCIFLTACSSTQANDLKLSLVQDGKGEKNYIYYDYDRVVYVIDGIMMIDIDGSATMLDAALFDGKVTVSSIVSTAETDFSDGDIECKEYPDGSKEFHYDTFNLVVLNTVDAVHDIYFVPTNLSYYDCIN